MGESGRVRCRVAVPVHVVLFLNKTIPVVDAHVMLTFLPFNSAKRSAFILILFPDTTSLDYAGADATHPANPPTDSRYDVPLFREADPDR